MEEESSAEEVQAEQVDHEFEAFKTTGELDLPGDDDDEEEDEESEEVAEDDGELDDYYNEIGIDPSEMKSTKSDKKHAKN